jgi:5'-3' exoribonuclease 2
MLLSKEEESVCVNYLEGLEWVYKYYTKDCEDWEWRYKYDYAPLMKDIIKHIPKRIILKSKKEGLSEREQLMYVLPYENMYLLEEKKEINEELYPKHYEFKWGYCRYFWEAHPILPEITIDMLKKM